MVSGHHASLLPCAVSNLRYLARAREFPLTSVDTKMARANNNAIDLLVLYSRDGHFFTKALCDSSNHDGSSA